MAGPIRISILANANQAISAFNRTGAEAKTLGSRLGTVSGVLKTALVGAGIYKGVEILTSKLKEANETVQEQAQLSAQTAAVLKSTGGAANVSAAQITAMGEALEGKSLIDAEATRAGENLLLTFTNIRNEAGRGNDVFNQTTQAMADLATAMKTDPTSAAKLLGKALNDPVGGLTALKKAGVSFTEQQKDQIGTLVKSGKTMDAQKIILGELSKEFGGSAAAAASTASGSFFRLKDSIDTVFESIVRKALPVLGQAAEYLTTNVPKAVAAAQPAINAIRDAFSSLADQAKPVTDFLREHPELLRGAAIALGIAAVAALGLAAAMAVVSVATSPITLTVVAIAAVGAAVAYAYRNSEQFRVAVQQLGQVITTTVVPALRTAAAYFTGTIIPALVRTAQTVATNLRPILSQLATTFASEIRPAIAQVAAKFVEWQPTIKRVAIVVGEVIAKLVVFEAKVYGTVIPALVKLSGFIIAKMVPAVLGFIETNAKIIGGLISFAQKVGNAAQKVASFASTVARKIAEVVTFFVNLPGQITGAIGDLGGLLLSAGASIVQGLIDGITSKIGALKSKLGELTKLIPLHKGPPAKDKVLLKQAGVDIMSGLIAGFSQGSEGVEASLKHITDLIEKHFDKALDKTKHQIDAKYNAIDKDLRKKLKGKALSKALDRSDNARDKAQKKAENASTKAQRALTKSTKDLRSQILANGAAQDTANQSLQTAKDTLQAMVDNAQQYADSIRDAVVASGSLSSLAQGDGFSSVDQLITQRTAAVARAQQFADTINGLVRAGLNTNDIQDLISQGVDQGLGTAKALLDGGPAVIAQMNTLSAQLVTTGTTLGANLSQTMYGAGIQAQQGLVDGLQANLTALIAQGDALGKALIKAVKKALKVHSPSKAFEEIGRFTVRGLGIGLDDTYVRRQGTQLATSLTKGFGTPALDAYMSTATGSGAGGAAVQINVVVPPTADKVAIGKEIQGALDAYYGVGGRQAS